MDWFGELDLDPASSWLRMGTRQLGSRPWLLVDEHRDAQLRLKAELLADHGREVFDARPGSEAPGREVLDLVVGELGMPAGGEPGRHPLDAAGRLVQEDLCLLQHRWGSWHLDAASLCFPSRWRLQDKLGHPIATVHGPVPGYAPALVSRVDRFLDKLGARPVWRRNWFIHPDPALHQPTRPPGGDPVVPAADCAEGLWLRSERQTLRRLEDTGWILFTIRIQRASLGEVLDSSGRARSLLRYLQGAPARDLSHRGLSPEQVVELRSALSAPLAARPRPDQP